MKVNAVFEGGGVRGIALAGAAAAAIDAGFEFSTVVGTSAGALVASLIVAGYSPDEMSSSVCAVDWPGLLDAVPGSKIPLIGRHIALLTRRGLYRSGRLERVWGRLLEAKGIRTFSDLPGDRLKIVATDLSHSRGIVLPDDLALYGIDPASFPVARALRMSAAVPFIFTPVTVVDTRTGDRVVVADGAMAANYPIGVAPRDLPILGFRLIREHDGHEHQAITGPFTLARSTVVAGIRARYSLPRPVEAGARVVEVPVRADLDFDLSNEAAREAFDRGRRAAEIQLSASAA